MWGRGKGPTEFLSLWLIKAADPGALISPLIGHYSLRLVTIVTPSLKGQTSHGTCEIPPSFLIVFVFPLGFILLLLDEGLPSLYFVNIDLWLFPGPSFYGNVPVAAFQLLLLFSLFFSWYLLKFIWSQTVFIEYQLSVRQALIDANLTGMKKHVIC